MTPASSTSHALAGHVARLYYDRQLSKVEIATRLRISRFKVARLIDQARSEGLVRIEFHDPVDQEPELGRELEERFGLDLCVVAAPATSPAGTTATATNEPLDGMATLAASVLHEAAVPGSSIGIAWGSTLAAVARAVTSRSQSGVTVVQLAGSSRHLEPDRGPGEVSRLLAERLSARHLALYAPAFVESAALRAALVRQPELSGTFEAYNHLALAVVGIGAVGFSAIGTRSSLLESGALSDEDIDGLRRLGAVGDLVVHPFDAAGQFVAPELGKRALAIDLEALRRTRVMAVAAGAAKGTAISGALATGIIRVLVTDAAAARAVLGGDRAEASARGSSTEPKRSAPAGSR